jgi:hypothetical protein
LNCEHDFLKRDEVGSIWYDLEWDRGSQARVEELLFKLAGNSEDEVPSIYATLGCDIRINELYSMIRMIGM